MRQSTPGFLSVSSRRQFRNDVLAWYDRHRRDLPWRENHDPYRVWLSEIMLQQTRVAAVIGHYQEFLLRFPSVEKLAAAREASVLAAWSGLGYYRRARMLHAAAKEIVREHGGAFPASEKELLALPGIGRYTAAAIASIAFGESVAVVDGNVERVLQRLYGERLAGEELWGVANLLLDAKRPGDFNQAIMELGATVCTPRAPSCLTCPVVAFCVARGELPAPAKSEPQKKREVHYVVHCRENRDGAKPAAEFAQGVSHRQVLLVQRKRTASLMPGMWELPELPSTNLAASPLFTLRHSITVTDYTVRVWRADAGSSAPSGSPPTRKWIHTARLNRIALTGLARKILRKAALL